ncbi:MAG: glycosyltransferase family 2 protein [Chloroflexi bacterium]|jgi:glycosyltransferase involved in cell wall biosynthesis|nr:glycosyltransferase family 2 protein [Chloroflexota bacterium]
MKLIININCHNEEQTLPQVLESIPRELPGISKITVQIIDDGSTDKTAEIARRYCAKLIQHKRNRGLGHAFKTGVEAAISSGCDIFVNTDGDNQYPAAYIPDLIQPILDSRADIVIGNRKPWALQHFSFIKRFFQRVGNFLVNQLIDTPIPDTISGFRAYSAYALMRLQPTIGFSYTLDTLVQAARKGLQILSVPINVNVPTRSSRLYKNIFQYIFRSSHNILWVYIVHEPFKTFNTAALFFLAPAAYLLVRFLSFYFHGQGGHIQSLIISAIGFSLAGILFSLGVIAKLVSYNRNFVEELLFQEKKRRWEAARSDRG